MRPALASQRAACGSAGAVRSRRRARWRRGEFSHKNVEYVVADLSRDDYQEYYNGFANRVLWPILHYRLDLAEFARRDLTAIFASTTVSRLRTRKDHRTRRRDLGSRLSSHSDCGRTAAARPCQPHRFLSPRADAVAGGVDLAAAITSGSCRCCCNMIVVGFQTERRRRQFRPLCHGRGRRHCGRETAGVRDIGQQDHADPERSANPHRQLSGRHRTARLPARWRGAMSARRSSRSWSQASAGARSSSASTGSTTPRA